MLKELLGERIYFEKDAKDWKDALQLTCQSLLKDECIEPRYIHSIISTVEELGPYLILHNSIVLPPCTPARWGAPAVHVFFKIGEWRVLSQYTGTCAYVFFYGCYR